MATRPLFTQGSVTLDGTGYGLVTFRPSGETWTIQSVTVNVNNTTAEARSNSYKGYVGPAYLVDATYTGSSGDTSDTIHELQDGEAFLVEWVGGTPGATASVNMRGTINFRESALSFRAN